MDCCDDYILAECNINDLNNIEIKNFPEKLSLKLHDSHGFGTFLFYEVQARKYNEKISLEFICHTPNKYWDGKWGLATYLEAIRKQVDFEECIDISDIELKDDWKTLSLIVYYDLPNRMDSCITDASNKIKALVRTAEISLGRFTWKNEYEQDEILFCKEIITPLLRRMKFLNVRFNHGTKEYGKDYTFSELTPFGDLRHYGLQAKAGNLSGGVNSQIDEIIGQIEDAFNMPYHEIGSKDERFISTFIVTISGRFTENAKEKIVQKIKKGLIGSVYFFDKEKIFELIEKYWTTV
ncbi:hypothetical protein [Clostridium brassicae]|uniref:Restriction endonuclease type IV Mrr domain-containing protein n=1 Tax=Clostridium brassicae TaxID=2999072 RepID=A0ABT4D808_9CLOT|nr:hypothetical protein [Clostridium brassicae]MCY6958423.1 hypothetical protein [Clostridium brassicae]